jgi:FtsH ternary system domain X5
MSRAYRITVKESVTREIAAGDEICTDLELLEILPPEAMARLLSDECKRQGFEEQEDGTLVRKEKTVTVTIDPCNGEVSVKAAAEKTVTQEGSRESTAYDDLGLQRKKATEQAKEVLRGDLNKKIDNEQTKLQAEVSGQLEKELHDLQPDLSQIVNKVTREALKQKAAQLGTIQEISEDAQTGSMTIKVEV